MSIFMLNFCYLINANEQGLKRLKYSPYFKPVIEI